MTDYIGNEFEEIGSERRDWTDITVALVDLSGKRIDLFPYSSR